MFDRHRIIAAAWRFVSMVVTCIVVFTLAACETTSSEDSRPTDRGGKNLAAERFSGSSLPSGWKFDREGVWSIRNGRLRAALPDKKQEKSFAFLGSEGWQNYAVELDVRQVRGVDKGLAVRVQGEEGVGVDLRGGEYQDIVMYRGYSQLGKARAPNRNGRWYRLRVEVKGNQYRVFVGRKLAIDVVDEGNKSPAGRIALAAYTGGAGECEVLYDNLVVRSLP